jgi:DHA1 family bicyclomycin/chloramphenicol resistance-like MFS transporter
MTSQRRYLHPDSPWLLALLASLVALGPLSIDMYLPAMPAMARSFDTTIGGLQLTISAYLAGFALCHLACGPLSDRFGRKPILIGGTALFVLASIGCSLAQDLDRMLLFRFVQGVGACVGPTLARAAARDIFGPARAARALSYIAMLMALAPAIAPLLGGFLLLWLPWPSVFVFLALYGLVTLPLIVLRLPESLPQRQSLHPLSIARNYLELVRDPLFLTVTTASALIYAGLMIYLGSSSLVFIELLGVPVQWYGLIFTTTVMGYMIGSFTSARLSAHRSSEQLALFGALASCAGSIILAATNAALGPTIAGITLPVTLYACGMGLVLPNAMATALKPFPHIAGTASALLGFIQMGLSSVAAALLGHFLVDSATPMALAMLGLSCTCVVLMLVVRSRLRAGLTADA